MAWQTNIYADNFGPVDQNFHDKSFVSFLSLLVSYKKVRTHEKGVDRLS